MRSMRRINAALDFCADHVGDVYFVLLGAVALAGVAVAIYSTL